MELPERKTPRRAQWAVIASMAVALSTLGACADDESTTQDPPPADTVDTQPASPAPHVRFKGNEVIANDLSRGLELEHAAICNELGAYSCTDLVHKVTLGGVDAYDRQIYEPRRDTTATTPLASERVVLSACLERAKRDLEGPGAPVVYAGLDLTSSKLADPHAEAVATAIDQLYVRLLQRHASAGEIAALEQHYVEIEASGDATPAKSWAALSCFAVGTSTEFLFY